MDSEQVVPARGFKAEKVGAVAAASAIVALIVELGLITVFSRSGTSDQRLGFICGCIVLIASLTSFTTAFFGERRHRFTFIAISVAVVFIHVIAAFANFGH